MGFSIGSATDSRHHTVTLEVAGEIDSTTAPRFQHEVIRQVLGRPPHLVIDLSAVTRLDTSALAALAEARTLTRGLTRITVILPHSHVLAPVQRATLAAMFAIDSELPVPAESATT
ncbi:STAS domain-containing protein [Prauserella oleivorans]|uniref:STAS domain-containing protein n=1 Tax=Prauserella oleivorans TaxID=1478153 RepID=A0ABW5W455_9PSEU